jgi:hypothetical protein
MKRKGTIVRYSIEEIRQMNRGKGSGIDWEKVNAMTPEDIERLADEDDKRLGIDPSEWGRQTVDAGRSTPDDQLP